MNVALTLHHHSDPRAGASGAVSALSDAMARGGASTRVFTFDDMPKGLAGKAQELAFPWWCAVRFSGNEFDVLDASTGDAWLLATMRHRRRMLIVTHSHGLEHVMHEALLSEVQEGRSRVSWRYPLYHGGYRLFEVARSLRASDLCIFLNDADRDYAVNRLGVEDCRARVLPNGCAHALLEQTPDIRPPTDGLVIVQLGSYISRKGIATTASAMDRFLGANLTARMCYLGTGCDAATVRADFHPSHHGRIDVTRSYDRSNLMQLLDGAHILLFPSVSEGFPLSLVEGMACGLTPITSRIPGPDQMVIDDENGLYVSVGDADAILAHLVALAADPDRLCRLRLAARARALSFRWRDIADRRLALYDDFCGRRRGDGVSGSLQTKMPR